MPKTRREKCLILEASDPAVRAMLSNGPAMQYWEVLRRSRSPLSTAQLATACRTKAHLVQQALDRLEGVGLVERLKASAARRLTTYRTTSEALLIGYDGSSATEVEWLNGYVSKAIRDRRVAIERTLETRPKPEDRRFITADLEATFNKAEAQRAQHVLLDAYRALADLELRAFLRRQSGEVDPGDPESRGFQMTFEMHPLDSPPLPRPQYTLWDRGGVPPLAERIAQAPGQILTAREKEVAQRLAAGESRPKIAEALGISRHTVATTGKRVYMKLKVHSRAELAARMRGS
jgi:DNA-binding CsgD family transcriptional regulator